MADDGLFLDDLDLASVAKREDLAELLNEVHVRADSPSYRCLSTWAARHSKSALPKSTVGEILQGRFPRKEKLLVFLEACGVPADELKPWRAAWERIAFAERRREQEEAAGLEQHRARVLHEAEARAEEILAEARRTASLLAVQEAADLEGRRELAMAMARAQATELVERAHVRAEQLVAEAETSAEALRRRAEGEQVSVVVLVERLLSLVQDEMAQELFGGGRRYQKLSLLHTALNFYMESDERTDGEGTGDPLDREAAEEVSAHTSASASPVLEPVDPDEHELPSTDPPGPEELIPPLPTVDELLSKIQGDRRRAQETYLKIDPSDPLGLSASKAEAPSQSVGGEIPDPSGTTNTSE